MYIKRWTFSRKKSSCPLANISVFIWGSSGGTHGSTAVTQPSTADRLTAVACRADVPHLPVVEFLNSIVNYFSIFTLNTKNYELQLLPKSNHKPSFSEQNFPGIVYGIYSLYNYCIYIDMVLTYK